MEYATHDIKIATLRLCIIECSQQGYPALKEKLIGCCAEKWGTARQTAQSLIKELESREIAYCDGEEIWEYGRWQKILRAREKDYNKMQDIINKKFSEVSVKE